MGERQGKTRVQIQREEKEKLWDGITVCLYKHKPSQTSGQIRGKQTERESFDQNIFLLEAAVTNLSSPLGKTFPSLSSFKDNLQKGKAVWSNIDMVVYFLSLGTAKGQSQLLTRGHAGTKVRPPLAGGLLLTSASTSFFFMPSEESSRFCSFSSSRSARSFAWRIFCSSSVASVLAFTAYQERRDRAWMANLFNLLNGKDQGTLSIHSISIFQNIYTFISCCVSSVLRCTYKCF